MTNVKRRRNEELTQEKELELEENPVNNEERMSLNGSGVISTRRIGSS